MKAAAGASRFRSRSLRSLAHVDPHLRRDGPSIVHRLAGTYSPWRGTVRVDGRNPRELSDEKKRETLGVVPQVAQLFSGTVLENLTLKDAGVPRGRASDRATSWLKTRGTRSATGS